LWWGERGGDLAVAEEVMLRWGKSGRVLGSDVFAGVVDVGMEDMEGRGGLYPGQVKSKFISST
jgi:hypothetical protein